MTRTSVDLWSAFFALRSALQISIAGYDAGMKFEAPRIANAVFLLVGRGMRSHTSILDQLCIQDRSQYYMSNGNETLGSPLIVTTAQKVKEDEWVIFSQPAGFFLRQSVLADFEQWWNQAIHTTPTGLTVNRATLVRLFRDKEGGAHFDNEVHNEEYRNLLNGDIGVYYENGGVQHHVPWGLHTMVRQVGEELLRSTAFLEVTFDAPVKEYTWQHIERFS